MKRLLLSCLGLTLMGAGCSSVNALEEGFVELTLPSGTVVETELAITRSEQAQGLSGREVIEGGMLFCFPKSVEQHFWMSGMLAPIDMIWVQDGRVEGISADVPIREEDDWARRSSGEPVNMVLELPAGWSERELIEVGSFIEGANEACAEALQQT